MMEDVKLNFYSHYRYTNEIADTNYFIHHNHSNTFNVNLML